MKNKNHHNFMIIYAMGFLLSLSMAVPGYVNSTFLNTFVSEKTIGIFFTVASLVTLLILVWLPRILKKRGNFLTTLVFLVINIISLVILAFAPNFWFVIIAFIFHIILNTLLLFNLDLFLENISDNSDTGTIRGSYLSILSMAWVIAPIIAGFTLTNGDYWKIYTISLVMLLPMLILLIRNFRKFEDVNYEETPIIKTAKIIWSKKDVFRIFTASFFLRFFYSWMVIYIPLYLHEHIGFEWTTIGIIFTIMLLPFVLLELPLGRLADEKYGEKEMLSIGFIIMGIFSLLLSFTTTTNPVVWASILFFTRVGASMVEVSTESYFFKKIDGDDTNILSFFRMMRPMAYIIGPLFASILLIFTPFRYLFIFLGFIIIIGGLSQSLKLKDTK